MTPLPLCFAFVHDEAVAKGDHAAEDEANGGNEFFAWSAWLVFIWQVGFVDDLNVHGFHGFLDLVLFALLNEVRVNRFLDFGVTLEFEVSDHFVRVFADVGVDFGFFRADGFFTGFGGTDGSFSYGLVLEELHLGGVETGGAGVDDGADFTREVALELIELLLSCDDGRMVVSVFLAQAGELDFLGDNLAADALDGTVVVDVVGFGAGLLLAELVRGDVVLGLGGFLLALEVGDGFIVGRGLRDSLFKLFIRTVEFVFTRKVGELLGGIVGVFLGLFNAAVEELDEQALGLLAVVRLHGQEVVDDFLGDLLSLFWGLSLGGDGDEVRALRVLDVEVRLGKACGIRLLLGVFALVELVDNRVEDGAALHELHVVVGGARRAAARRSGEHSRCLTAYLLAGAARLDEGGRLVLLRQDKGGDRRDGRAADDDAANDFLVFLRDLPELAEVNAFFFL